MTCEVVSQTHPTVAALMIGG